MGARRLPHGPVPAGRGGWGARGVAAWAVGWGCAGQCSCTCPHICTISPLGGVAAGLFTLVVLARRPPEDMERGASALLSAGPGALELSQVHGGAGSHQLRHRGPRASAAPD